MAIYWRDTSDKTPKYELVHGHVRALQIKSVLMDVVPAPPDVAPLGCTVTWHNEAFVPLHLTSENCDVDVTLIEADDWYVTINGEHSLIVNPSLFDKLFKPLVEAK